MKAVKGIKLSARHFTHGRYQVGTVTSFDTFKGQDREKLKSMDFLHEYYDTQYV